MTKFEIGSATLYLGDCLEIVCGMPEESIDAVMTDPPFSSGARTDAGKAVRGAMLRGAKWQSDWFSHDNMATHGAESCDGTGWFRGDQEQLAGLERYLEESSAQGRPQRRLVS